MLLGFRGLFGSVGLSPHTPSNCIHIVFALLVFIGKWPMYPSFCISLGTLNHFYTFIKATFMRAYMLFDHGYGGKLT